MPRLTTSPVLPQTRRSSSNRRRKTAKEIERDFHDSDDELPEDAVITNVPISPRPVPTASPSKSPERGKIPSGYLSSPGTVDPPKTPRTKSWDAAMSDLSAEVRELTSKLADHYDSSRRNSDESHSSSGSERRLTPAYQRAKTWAVPPVQKGDAMVDPFPASKEKERYLTRTRPSWLPPKCPKEERKHMKEYQRMITSFMESEQRKSAQVQQKRKSKEDDESDALKNWRRVLANWDESVNTPQTRDLWWRGVPPALRSQVWTRAIGNDLQLSGASYRAALARAKGIEQRLKSPKLGHSRQISLHESKSDSRARRSLSSITSDIELGAFPQLNLFQLGQPRHEELRDLLLAYAAYREDTGHVRGTAGIAALLLLHHPVLPPSSPPPSSNGGQSPGLDLSASDSASAAAFIALANLLNRPLNLAFCLNDAGPKDRTYTHIMKALKHKLPHLHTHFETLTRDSAEAIGFEELLAPLCQSLFTSHLSPADAARVCDVIVFEGDGVVVRGVVGTLGRLESGLYGAAEEVAAATGWTEAKDGVSTSEERRGSAQTGVGGARPVNMGGEDGAIRWLKWAGRSENGA